MIITTSTSPEKKYINLNLTQENQNLTQENNNSSINTSMTIPYNPQHSLNINNISQQGPNTMPNDNIGANLFISSLVSLNNFAISQQLPNNNKKSEEQYPQLPIGYHIKKNIYEDIQNSNNNSLNKNNNSVPSSFDILYAYRQQLEKQKQEQKQTNINKDMLNSNNNSTKRNMKPKEQDPTWQTPIRSNKKPKKKTKEVIQKEYIQNRNNYSLNKNNNSIINDFSLPNLCQQQEQKQQDQYNNNKYINELNKFNINSEDFVMSPNLFILNNNNIQLSDFFCNYNINQQQFNDDFFSNINNYTYEEKDKQDIVQFRSNEKYQHDIIQSTNKNQKNYYQNEEESKQNNTNQSIDDFSDINDYQYRKEKYQQYQSMNENQKHPKKQTNNITSENIENYKQNLEDTLIKLKEIIYNKYNFPQIILGLLGFQEINDFLEQFDLNLINYNMKNDNIKSKKLFIIIHDIVYFVLDITSVLLIDQLPLEQIENMQKILQKVFLYFKEKNNFLNLNVKDVSDAIFYFYNSVKYNLKNNLRVKNDFQFSKSVFSKSYNQQIEKINEYLIQDTENNKKQNKYYQNCVVEACVDLFNIVITDIQNNSVNVKFSKLLMYCIQIIQSSIIFLGSEQITARIQVYSPTSSNVINILQCAMVIKYKQIIKPKNFKNIEKIIQLLVITLCRLEKLLLRNQKEQQQLSLDKIGTDSKLTKEEYRLSLTVLIYCLRNNESFKTDFKKFVSKKLLTLSFSGQNTLCSTIPIDVLIQLLAQDIEPLLLAIYTVKFLKDYLNSPNISSENRIFFKQTLVYTYNFSICTLPKKWRKTLNILPQQEQVIFDFDFGSPKFKLLLVLLNGLPLENLEHYIDLLNILKAIPYDPKEPGNLSVPLKPGAYDVDLRQGANGKFYVDNIRKKIINQKKDIINQ